MLILVTLFLLCIKCIIGMRFIDGRSSNFNDDIMGMADHTFVDFSRLSNLNRNNFMDLFLDNMDVSISSITRKGDSLGLNLDFSIKGPMFNKFRNRVDDDADSDYDDEEIVHDDEDDLTDREGTDNYFHDFTRESSRDDVDKRRKREADNEDTEDGDGSDNEDGEQSVVGDGPQADCNIKKGKLFELARVFGLENRVRDRSCNGYTLRDGTKSIGCVRYGCCQYEFQRSDLRDCFNNDIVCCFSYDQCRRINFNPPSTTCPDITSRSTWGAKPPTAIVKLPNPPVKFATIHHTSGKGCKGLTACSKRLKEIQEKHMSIEYVDIGYSFLISEDGTVYEGRGWDREGGHTCGYNMNGVGIAIIGNYENTEPSAEALASAKQLLACGVTINKLQVNYMLRGHRDMDNSNRRTVCPGQKLYNIIKKWTHYA